MTNYNLSLINGSDSSLTVFMQFANDASLGVFGVFLIIGFFIVTYVSLKNFGNKPAIAASGFITLIFTYLARAAGATTDRVLFATIFLVAGIGAYLYITKD